MIEVKKLLFCDTSASAWDRSATAVKVLRHPGQDHTGGVRAPERLSPAACCRIRQRSLGCVFGARHSAATREGRARWTSDDQLE